MIIHFDNVLEPGSGPGTFASRLAWKLFFLGHKVQFTNENADISLVFIERSGAPLAKKVVQRLDGIWFKPDEFHHKNRNILSLYREADGVVYQSEFDQRFIEKWWGSRSSTTIIRNGVRLEPVKEITIPALAKLRADYNMMYVCSANWHPQKRLQENIELFLRLHQRNRSSCLLILGKNPYVRISHPDIFYAGAVEPEIYNQIYATANWMIHLAWADHCPNVVIEALAQGTPILCSEIGGTKELIGNYGIVLRENSYNFELADYDNPPPIDITQVSELPPRSSLDYSSISDINIDSVANKYVDFFTTLLESR